MTHELTLTLPLPPSPNQWPSHPMEKSRQKNDYRKRAWVAAIQQHPPVIHPPERVVATALCRVHNLRDEDNLAGALKWTWDALKQEQNGAMRWRQGVADRKGYLVDDDPAHLHVASVEQEIDRNEQGVDLTLRWVESEEGA